MITTTRFRAPRLPSPVLLALIGILSLAFLIRIVGIDWDEGRYLHPDERHIVADVLIDRVGFSWPPSSSWLDPDQSPINPRPEREGGGYEGFAYGTFPVYTVDILGSTATELTGDDWTGYDRIEYIGRALSILLDTATVLLAYLIGARLVSRTAGLVGAAIYAFLPLAIQASHFFIVDSWLTFFLAASLYTCINAVTSRSMWQFPLAAAWYGLAMATKTTAAPFAGVIILAIALAALQESRTASSFTIVAGRAGARSVVSLAVFLAVFMFGEPFAFIQPDAYLDSFRQQADIQSGTWDVPFTQQYVGTPRGAYQLREAVRYSMGPIAALVGMAGAMGLPWLAWRRKSPEMLVLAAWIGGFALVILYPETKWPRYTLPLAPALAVCAGIAIAGAAHYLRRRTGRALAIGFTALLLTISTGWGAAFAQVTMEEHTRLAASIWLFENLPPGSTTTSEIWDDRLPLSLGPGHSADARRIDDASINLYTYTPTLGDIARLGPAVAELPRGHRMATLLEVGRVDEALEIIRSLATTDFAAQQAADAASTEASSALRTRPDATPDRAATFQFELIRASSAMTTSRDLSVSVQQIAGDVALDNAISPAMLEQLAASIEASASRTSPDEIHALLEDADAYVVASDRVERGMDQNPWRYAVPVRMYELLDSGELGYGQARSFHSYPSLFGLTFSDAGADETFINYDHPVVRVYEKQARTEDLPVVELFGSAALAQTDPSRDPDTEPMTFDEPVSDLPIVDDYRWSESLTGSSWGAAAVWIVMLVALQAAAWPLARSVFRSFPDSGWGLTRLVGMLVPATALWWLSSVGLIQFLSVWVAVTSALFALACWWLLHRETVPAPGSRWRTIGVAEGIFWATFAVFLVYKLINPDSWHPYWGGEKPMEFAQINAILRSPSFPPVDPWYAQGYINYYYYSFYLVAFLIKLTGIPTEYAFNLAQPMVMGMLASATFSVGAMLGSRITKGRQNGIMSGLISVALVSFAGNMMSVGQLVDGLQGEEPTLDPFSHWVWNPSRAILDNGAQLITEFPYFTGLYGDLHSHVMGMPLLVLSVGIAATFAFDFPRLHELGHRRNVARLMVSVIALGVIYPTNAWDLPVTAGVVAGGMLVGSATQHWIRPRLTSLGLIAVPITIGALIVSLPFVLRFEALFGEIETVRATTSVLELETHAGGLLLVATATIPLLIATITLSSRSRTVMFWAYPVLAILLLARWLATDRAPDAVSLLDKTTAILVASIWVLAIGAPRGPRQRFDFRLPKFTTLVLGIAGMAAVMSFVVDDNPVAALYVGIAAGSTCVWLWKRPASLRFLALLVAGAGYIGAGVEIVFLVDDLAGTDWARMNTVFKFYNQIWILLAIAGGSTAGVFVTAFLTRLARAGTPGGVTRQLWRLQLPAMSSFVTALVLLLATAYPIAATGVRLDARFEPREGGPTLNAYDWMEYGSVQLTDGTVIGFEEDRDVIDWFNAQVGGTPVIAEAAFAPYRCNSSRISIGTGLPSVLGWARHEMQQRHPEVLPQRDADLRTLYASQDPNEKLSILNRYDVHYVIVGDLERSYPVVAGNDCVPMGQSPLYRHLDLGAGVGTFEEMVGENLEVAFQSGDTIVYRVVGNT